MKKVIIPLLLVSTMLVSSNNNIDETIYNHYKNYVRSIDVNNTSKIKNVIVFIGDGMGPNHIEASEIFAGREFVFSDEENDMWTYHAYSNTDSLTSVGFTLDETKSLLKPSENKSLYDDMPSPYGSGANLSSGNITGYTDSAAGGTAISTGVKVTNSRIGKDIYGNDLTNLVEIASSLGKKTGVLTSDNLAGATPASFLAHTYERHYYDEIIVSTSKSNADLIIAQTLSNWEDNKASYESMYKKAGFDNICYDVNSLNINSTREVCLLPAILPDGDRTPSLSELTAYSLDYLDNDNGFFLMVEGANIDKQSHSNQPLAMIKELLGFEEAVKTAQDWATGREDTLIVVTADHETGALTFDENNSNSENIIDNMKFLSYNHSRTRVTIDVFGDISEFTNKYAEMFSTLEGRPYWDNTDIFKLCASYL